MKENFGEQTTEVGAYWSSLDRSSGSAFVSSERKISTPRARGRPSTSKIRYLDRRYVCMELGKSTVGKCSDRPGEIREIRTGYKGMRLLHNPTLSGLDIFAARLIKEIYTSYDERNRNS